MCMGAGRRCRLLPAFSTHSASPQVACCEMSVAEKLKISALLLCSLLGLLGLWGLAGPWGPGGSRNCWMRGGVWGKKRRLSLQHTPSPTSSWAPKSGPRLTSIRRPSRTPQELPHALSHVHAYACVCVSVHLWCPELPGREIWPPSDRSSSEQDSASFVQGFQRTSLQTGAPRVERGVVVVSGIFSLHLGAPSKRAGGFLPRAEGQGIGHRTHGLIWQLSWGHLDSLTPRHRR